MNWNNLNSEILLKELISNQKRFVIFKYSPGCAINILVRSLFEREWDGQIMKHIPAYFLNISENRNLSDSISEETNVKHESPQLLVIENGKCTHSFSHGKIRFSELASVLNL